jgi:hypothetical protein
LLRQAAGMEVPCYLAKLLRELNEQRKRDYFCDCSILVEGRVFKAHRNVLFAGSGYFRALLVHYLQVRFGWLRDHRFVVIVVMVSVFMNLHV